MNINKRFTLEEKRMEVYSRYKTIFWNYKKEVKMKNYYIPVNGEQTKAYELVAIAKNSYFLQ